MPLVSHSLHFLNKKKERRRNDFQPKFAVLCEFLSVLVLQVGVIQDNAGFAESLLCLAFVLFFLFVVVFFFLVPSCKTCYRVAHVLPRNPIGFVMTKKTSSGENRFDRQGGVTSLEVVRGGWGGQRSALSARLFIISAKVKHLL